MKVKKSHLYRTLDNASLTFEELNRYCFNTCRSDFKFSPYNPHTLTSFRFIRSHSRTIFIGDSLNSLPKRDERDISDIDGDKLCNLPNNFGRDGLVYLTQFQERSKWSTSTGPQLKTGTVILIRDDNAPPLQWSIGRVMEVTRGADDQDRVAQVQTSKGTSKRAVRYLCPLPFEGN